MNRLPTHAGHLVALGLLLLAGPTGSAQEALTSGRRSVKSPDGTIEFSIQANGPLTYSVSVDGKPILTNSKLGLRFEDGMTLGANALLVKVEREESDTTRVDRLGKRREVRDRHNELRMFLAEATAGNRPFEIIARVFNDGVAFRYVLPATPLAAIQDFVLVEEQTQFSFPNNFPCFAGENENTGASNNLIGFVGSQEMNFNPTTLADLPTKTVRGAPLLVKTPAAYVNLAESDLRDWAGMWFSRVETPRRSGVTVAARLSPRLDGNGLVESAFPAAFAVAGVDDCPQAGATDRERPDQQPGLAVRTGRHLVDQAGHDGMGQLVVRHRAGRAPKLTRPSSSSRRTWAGRTSSWTAGGRPTPTP